MTRTVAAAVAQNGVPGAEPCHDTHHVSELLAEAWHDETRRSLGKSRSSAACSTLAAPATIPSPAPTEVQLQQQSSAGPIPAQPGRQPPASTGRAARPTVRSLRGSSCLLYPVLRRSSPQQPAAHHLVSVSGGAFGRGRPPRRPWKDQNFVVWLPGIGSVMSS